MFNNYSEATNEKGMLELLGHDFRGAIGTLVGFSRFLLKDIGEKHKENEWGGILERMVKIGEETIKMADDAVSVSKLNMGKGRLKPEWIYDLKDELEKSLHAFDAQADSKGIKLVFDVKGPLPFVNWDMKYLRSYSINNMLVSATKQPSTISRGV